LNNDESTLLDGVIIKLPYLVSVSALTIRLNWLR